MLRSVATAIALATTVTGAGAQDQQTQQTMGTDFAISREEAPDVKPPYSPFVGQEYPNRVFWGDSHLHTSYSWDAGLVGNTLGPDQAYRFAKGQEVTASSGQAVKLVRPLDWLVVADHSESLGLPALLERADTDLLATELGRRTYEPYRLGKLYEAFQTWGLEAIVNGNDPLNDNPDIARSVWEEITRFAEENNEPGLFTAFIGYEWTAAPEGNNLHRVVVYRDGASKAEQMLPFQASESADPEDLWNWMASYEDKTGGRLLAIPHNGNLSNGVMFQLETLSGAPIDRDYAERRAKWEPLYEVTQMKGDGEAHPALSPTDEFADYENWDRGNWNGVPKTADMLPYEYARSALGIGLQVEQKLGVNPFKFGMIGSTDSHTSLATTREDNNFGKVSLMEPKPDRFDGQIVPDPTESGTATYEYETIASGLMGVWARENTRQSLWDAMSRKET